MTIVGDPSEPDDDESGPPRSLVGRLRANVDRRRTQAEALLDEHRDRALVDVVLRLYERDREAAGTVVSSALASRLFLFFVPLLLFVVGCAGFLSGQISSDDVRSAGITESLARQIDQALSQPNTTRWIATVGGFIGMIWAGRTLSKVMAVASCLAWRLPLRAKPSARTVGATVGLVVGVGLLSVLLNRVRISYGAGAVGVSLVVVLAIYLVVAVGLTLLLPRATPDPGALLPGAAMIAAVIMGLQAVSQLYLPREFEQASELYGAMGIAVVTLGWFFITARTIVLALVVDAVVYERFGSVSVVVFRLPVLRSIARRSAPLRRFFGLDPTGPRDDDDVAPAEPGVLFTQPDLSGATSAPVEARATPTRPVRPTADGVVDE